MKVTTQRSLRAILLVSELQDGTPVYTASLTKLPGVVVEGRSEEEAKAKLEEVVEHISDTVGIPDEAFETASVKSWSWQSYSSTPKSRAPGPDKSIFSLPRELATA